MVHKSISSSTTFIGMLLHGATVTIERDTSRLVVERHTQLALRSPNAGGSAEFAKLKHLSSVALTVVGPLKQT